MIITRTPFRISFAGGGSDLEDYYHREPGVVLSTAINKYIYLTVKERFGNTFRVSYSQTELCDSVDQIQHPIVRESLKRLSVERGLEIVSVADLPAQAGMGSSSSFTVGLLHALHALAGHVVTPARLAEQACEVEIERLKEPIGKQDQYIAAYGGMQMVRFMPNGDVTVDPVICPRGTRQELNRRLVLFFTGRTRNAREVLAKQRATIDSQRETLRRMCRIAEQLREVLTVGMNLNDFGQLLHQAWEAKRSLESSISNQAIDDFYERGIKAGALGGKLLGAGSGGFLLFYCEPHLQARLRRALSGLVEVPFSFEPEGSKVIFVGIDQY